MDEQRRKALERRAELLKATRDEAEASIAEGRARLQSEVEAAREQLTKDAESLGAAISDSVLSGKS